MGLVVGLLENKDFNDWYDLKPVNDTVVVIRFLSEMMIKLQDELRNLCSCETKI